MNREAYFFTMVHGEAAQRLAEKTHGRTL